jgi:dethiobiotin synthetase
VRGLFVSGTDTGVGKTFVACALARGLREAGIDLGVMKPVETGVPATGAQDALALREAAGVDDPLELVCPLRFALPAAPEAAARVEGRRASLAPIREAFEELCARHAFVLVEGAGGLLVPFDPDTTMADLARELALPVLIVARASLGTINHTRLTLEAMETRGLELLGVVVSHSTGEISPADAENLDVLRRTLGARLIGELPAIGGGAMPSAEATGLAALIDRIVATRSPSAEGS